MKFEPFTYKTLSSLKNKIEELDLNIPISPELEIIQTRIKINDRLIPNRLAIQPMEGYDAKEDGSPSDLTLRRYRRYARGGVGLIWFEATAISGEGKSNQQQLLLTKDNAKNYKSLVVQVREECNKTLKELGFKNEVMLILQLNHSGRYSKIGKDRVPLRGYKNKLLDDAMNISENAGKILTDIEIKNIEDSWVEKALLAKEIGFDGVDIKSCHGYLISELLAGRNRENSVYGGLKLKDRSALLMNIISRLNKFLGNKSDFIITTRLSAYTGIPDPNGFGNKSGSEDIDLSEPIQLIKMLYEKGMRLINISTGNPYFNPYITRPFDVPIKGKDLPPEHPLVSVNRIIQIVADIKKNSLEDMVIIGSGYSYLRQYAGHVAAGLLQQNMVDICGFGRMAFANPEFPKQILKGGGIDKKLTCITCSKCSQFMREGRSTGCAIRDPEYR